MPSKQAQAVLDVMQTSPTHCWTASSISVKLNCAPDLVRGRLRPLLQAGLVERVCEGEYRLTREPKPKSATRITFNTQVTTTTAAKKGTPAKTETVHIPVTDLMREQLLGALRAYGQPLHPSTLAGRMKRSGFNLQSVLATAEVLTVQNQLRRLPDGKLALPEWKVRP